MRSRTASSALLREALALQRRRRQLDDRVGQRLRVGRAQAPGDAVLDDRARAALGHRDDRQPAGLRLEQDLPEGVGAAGEEEEVGARVGARQRVALQPAQEARVLAEALAQRVLLGAAAGQAEVQARVALAGGEEGVGQQVGPLLARQPPGVEDAELARQRARRRAWPGEKRATSTPRSQRPIRSASIPIPRRTSSDAGLGLRTTWHCP